MRNRDRERYKAFGKKVHQLRWPDKSTGAIAEDIGRAQPWVSEMERAQRLADLFDAARVAKSVGLDAAGFGQLIYSLIDDPKLEGGPGRKPPGRKTRGKQNN